MWPSSSSQGGGAASGGGGSSPSSTQQQRRRRRRNNNNNTNGASFFTIATTAAVVAYGGYRLATWAYQEWNNSNRNDDDDEEEDRMEGVAEGVAKQSRETTPWNLARREQQQQQQQQQQTRADDQQEQEQQLAKQRWSLRRSRIQRCREETMQALQGLLPTVQRMIEERTQTTLETKTLKRLRRERQEQSGEKLQEQPPSNDYNNNKNNHHRAKPQHAEGAEEDQRAQEAESWNIIKVQNMTRMVATAYAHTVLFLVLTVQVHLLGGRLLDEQLLGRRAATTTTTTTGGIAGARSSASWGSSTAGEFSTTSSTTTANRMEVYRATHHHVLTHTYEYFFEAGLLSLIQTVERAVTQVLEPWHVGDAAYLHMTPERFQQALEEIRAAVEKQQRRSRATAPAAPRTLMRFLMPPTAATTKVGLYGTQPPSIVSSSSSPQALGAVDDHLAQSILEETFDLLESPVLMDAQQDCLQATFDRMRDLYWGNIFAAPSSSGGSPTTTTTKPLAHVLTQLKHTSNSFYEADRTLFNSYSTVLGELPSVLEAGDISFN